MLLLAWLACTPAEEPAACGADGGLSVAPSDAVSTVVEVAWTGPESGEARVEVHDADGGVLASAWRGGGAQSATLVGVPASSSLSALLVDDGGETLSACDFESGPLPTDLPELTLTGEPGWDGLLATSYVGASAASIVIDERGVVRWYTVTDTGLVYRTRFRADGGGVRYLFETNPNADLAAYVADIDWDGGGFTVLSGDQHPTHDFAVLDDGTLGMVTSYQIGGGPDDLSTGNKIVEVRPDGEIVELWDSLEGYFPGGVPEGADPTDYWTHGNTLQVDPERDAWWIGFRNRDSLVQVDRATGETLLRLGGAYSDYVFGNRARFTAQHAWQFIDGGILLHDNRDNADEDSRVVELAIDHQARTVEATAVLMHDPPVWVYAMGEPIRLVDGTTLVVWSSAGLIDSFAPDGTPLSSLASELGAGIGYIEYQPGFPGQVELR